MNKIKLNTCETVEEMITELQRLPPALPVQLFDHGVVMVVVNRGKHNEHLLIEGRDDSCWEEGVDFEDSFHASPVDTQSRFL